MMAGGVATATAAHPRGNKAAGNAPAQTQYGDVFHWFSESLKESPSIWILEIALVPSSLQEDAEDALVAVTRCVATGEPLIRCQLLASLFYEELLRQLRQCQDNSDRVILGTAAAQCGRAAIASTTPRGVLEELRAVVATLLTAHRPPIPPSRPVLRVIEGGLSKA